MDNLHNIVVCAKPNPQATRTLVCLGFCGGGSGPYLPWADVLPPDVELATICYPGRDGRFLDDYAEDWDALAEDATSAVLAAATVRPYVLFGHSMGGWMAFDVANRLEQRDGRLPEALVVSSANAPSRGLTPRDIFPAQHDTNEQLLDWMRTNGLLPGYVLDDPELREMALELMRADIRVRDTFGYTEGTGVSVPLQVLTGADDDVIVADTAEQWRALARGGYQHVELPGGHFYTPEIWRTLPSFINALAPLLAGH
ncbi:thioesterase II family protein [Amycolatopsis sp. H20-H5]|uniref:thioesterase II family protein n=1 Tax=Amycolatopsis sp. H20-H5 TaxID=3046309 RepID=UPI002DB603BE|nr:alpha/beta fold hydrolase [Amycolatopsis sp. H20-H5]MEC3978307.1 alpha/beta fold hydrolase [Amycolatopsis sp. H20-H5]